MTTRHPLGALDYWLCMTISRGICLPITIMAAAVMTTGAITLWLAATAAEALEAPHAPDDR